VYAVRPKKVYQADGKDRVLLFLTWGLGILLAGFLFVPDFPGFGVTLAVAAWYGILFWYKGLEGFGTRAGVLLFAAVAVLALTFSLYSNLWFRVWNLLFLCGLMAVQLFQWSGAARSWRLPTMLAERAALLCRGLFGALPAPLAAVRSFKSVNQRRLLAVGLGLMLTLPLLIVVVPLLAAADQYFALVAGETLRFLNDILGDAAAQAVLGLLAAPFLFSLLYSLRRPEERGAEKDPALPKADPALAVVVLAVMDLLYAFFVAVQFTALFGGPAYLERVGLTYAEYARSGFFQLVFVAGLNLSLTLAAVQFSRREGRTWGVVRLLCTALVAFSFVMLGSAAWRMTLYVLVYGLSFKRFLTYWGMVMLALFLGAALLKVWRREFAFFPVFFTAAVAGWLALNLCNVDFIVAKYNVALYQRQENSVMNLDYLACDLSYDALWVLEDLPAETEVYAGGGPRLDEVIAGRRAEAAREASHWQTWSVSAQLAAGGSR